MRTCLILGGILVLSIWIRIQGTERIPDGQFTGNDPYFYYWQASLISEHGHLPERDMHRWLPLGRDLGQTLNLYGYVLAYTHKAVALVFQNITLYHVCLYTPVVCFCIGLGALCFYLYHAYVLMFSLTAGLILATLPGSIERSTAGFGDRDAFCLMLGILAVVTYLVSLQGSGTPRKRLIWTLASGVIVFLGGISWEGFGVFLSVIIVIEIWLFLTTETEEGLGHFALWVCCFVPTLYLVSSAYRNGYGFAEHLAAFVLMPPLILLAMRAIRYLLISKVERLRPHTRTVSFGLILASATLVLGYFWIQHSTFADTTVPISDSPVMQAMSELKNPNYSFWVYRYGTFFIVGSLGFILLPLVYWRRQGLCISIPIVLFTLFSFFREHTDKLWGEPFGNALFGIACVGCAIGILLLAWQQKSKVSTSDFVFIAFCIWFLAWVALTRDAKRYDLFIGVPLAFGATSLLYWTTETLTQRLRHSEYVTDKFRETFRPMPLKIATALILLGALMFLPLRHAHTYRLLYAAKQMRKPTPGYTRVNAAFLYMKTFLVRKVQPKDIPIVAAHWGHGSQLNVLGGVKTITDQDTYIQNWILLYNQHVHNATSEREALEYLKTHGATHLMLTGKDPKDSFLRGELSAAFLPLYPKVKFADATVKVWAIDYPADIKNDGKYLETGFPEIDAHLQLK